MPRYYKYRRSYVKRVYPRKRWASNIVTKNLLLSLNVGEKTAWSYVPLVSNSGQEDVPTPTLLKFGRCKIKGDIRTDLTADRNYVSGIVYVVYVPEGFSNSPDIIKQHPEYIIGWTQLSLDSGNAFTFSSSLKRNLNSGDKIIILFTIDSTNSTQTVRAFNFYFTAQFWVTTS